MITEGMPVLLAPKTVDINQELLAANTEEGRQYRKQHFANPIFVDAAKKYLIFLKKRGFLDVD